MNIKDIYQELKSQVRRYPQALVLGGVIIINGFGLPMILASIDKPTKVETRDINNDGLNDIVAYNPLGRKINPEKFGGDVFYNIGENYFVSGRGTAEMIDGEVVINQFPYRPIKLNL